jgi:hypothetical protein
VYTGVLGISLNTHLLKTYRIVRDGTPVALAVFLPGFFLEFEFLHLLYPS